MIYLLYLGEDSNMSTRRTRSKVEEGTNDSWNWEEVLKKNPDACKGTGKEDDNNEKEAEQNKEIKRRQLIILEKPTLEMCKIMARLKVTLNSHFM